MYGQGYYGPQFRQGFQMYMPPAQQDHPPYPSTGFQTSTTTSQSYMVHHGCSSVTAHLSQPNSTIYLHLSPFPIPPSGTPNSGHSYSILPPHLHLNGNTQLMRSFPGAQQGPQLTQKVYQIPSYFPQPSPILPGQAPSRGVVLPTFPVGLHGVQPTLQPRLPLSSSMLNAHAFGSVAYAAPQVFHMPSALVPSLSPPPPRVPPPLAPSSPVGCPHARVMRSSLLNSMRNTGVYHLNTDSDIDMEDDITQIHEEQVISEELHELQLPTLQNWNSSATNVFSSKISVLGEEIKGTDHRSRTLPINTITTHAVGEDYFISLQGHGLFRSGSSAQGDGHTMPMLLSMRSPVTKLQSFGGDNQHSGDLLCSVSRNNAYWQQPSYHLQDHPTTDSVSVHVDEPADNSYLMSSYNSNSVDKEQSVHVYMHNDESNTASLDIEIKAVKRNKKSKRSKSLKRFKVALAEFVKKVLDPSWRRCNMSRFIFKTIVKKTVDKVSGSLKHHRVPKSQEKINCYIESSRSKLTSLVMAYMNKYVTGYNVAKY